MSSSVSTLMVVFMCKKNDSTVPLLMHALQTSCLVSAWFLMPYETSPKNTDKNDDNCLTIIFNHCNIR